MVQMVLLSDEIMESQTQWKNDSMERSIRTPSLVLTNMKIEFKLKCEINMAIINLDVMSYICAYSTEEHICSQKSIFSLIKKCAWV